LDTRDKLIGFFAAAVDGTRVLLDNLWVTPDLIGNGIGRQACELLSENGFFRYR
jgi:hypothetical protein